jgi:G3E family GTPase
MKRVRFVMLGGFLGAGKTTAIARLARHFIHRGQKVGLVTNDQAYGLVDTQSFRAQGFDVGEVAGACFCCKFDELVDTVRQLTERDRPDWIIAEPVGSCTDLVATVMEPLQQLYGQSYATAPLAVLLKPEHGEKILGRQAGVGFSPKAAYIFLKQLEEADVVAINKIDKLTAQQRRRLVELVAEWYPGKEVLAISARDGEGFDALVDALKRPGPKRTKTPVVDYETYAEGEAELGWLNCTVRLRRGSDCEAAAQQSPFPLDDVLVEMVHRLEKACMHIGAEPVHLKILGTANGRTAIANLVGSGVGVELSRSSQAKATSAELTVNARVATDPESLRVMVQQQAAALAEAWGLDHELADVQSFRPGRPVPTHRIALGQDASP